MPNTTDNFDIPFLDGTELVRDYPQFSEDLAEAIDDALSDVALGAGKILQVVYGSTTAGVTNTSLTLADTGLSATITPTSASSKILVVFNQSLQFMANSGLGVLAQVVLFRGSTSVATMRIRALSSSDIWRQHRSDSLVFLDSPNTTSATTYKTQFSLAESTGGGRLVRVQEASGLSGITLLEVAD